MSDFHPQTGAGAFVGDLAALSCGARDPAGVDSPGEPAMDDRPLIITDDDDVLDDLLRISAAAGVEVTHSRDPGQRGLWRSASVVLIDAPQVARAVSARLGRRPGVMVVAGEEPDAGLWEQCVRLGVERTVLLNQSEEFLVGVLSDAAIGGPGDGRCIAVVGACGGAGASVFAAALAVVAGRAGDDVLLADCDPWGPGLDVVLGVESDGGMRWTDLSAPSGRLPAEALRRALPAVTVGHGRLSVLCHDRRSDSDIDPEVVDVVLDSGRRAGVITVVDVPRHPTAVADRVLQEADLTVLLAPAEVRGCFAAGRICRRLADLGARPGLVVRGPSPGGLGAQDVADVLGLPLLSRVRAEPKLARDIEFGRLPGWDARSSVARAAGRVLASVGAPVR